MESPDFKTLAIRKKRKKIIIAVLAIIFVVAIVVAIYPFWPQIKYYIFPKPIEIPGIPEQTSILNDDTENIASSSEMEGNVLIIPKIGVKIPIVEGTTEATLNKGAWRLPETSTPDKGGNTVITGHRWKFRPPSEKTFYLLDKMETGDNFQIFWQGKEYNYEIISTNIVLPTDVYVLNPTENSVVTLITCTPLFSTAKRLIVRAELVTD